MALLMMGFSLDRSCCTKLLAVAWICSVAFGLGSGDCGGSGIGGESSILRFLVGDEAVGDGGSSLTAGGNSGVVSGLDEWLMAWTMAALDFRRSEYEESEAVCCFSFCFLQTSSSLSRIVSSELPGKKKTV